MPGFPFDIKVEMAFASAGTVNPTWTDVTSDVEGFSTTRGRSGDNETCQPGTLSVLLDNSSGRFDPDNTAGPFFGQLRPNRRVRISAMHTSSSPRVFLGHGYIDSLALRFPGGGLRSQVEVNATDRFKLLARRTLTATAPPETAAVRISNILLNRSGLTAAEVSINANGYASRNLGRKNYAKENTLSALQEIASSDGGLLFVNGAGVVVFQTTRYRLDNVRANTSQGTFGNTDGAVPVQADLAPTVDDDDMANAIRITDNNGKEYVVGNGANQANDGLLEFDLGSTLLLPADAQDRAADLLAARKDPKARVGALTLDCLTDDGAMAQALNRELSDRVTLSLEPLAYTAPRARAQYVEQISHSVQFGRQAQWTTTFQVSAV